MKTKILLLAAALTLLFCGLASAHAYRLFVSNVSSEGEPTYLYIRQTLSAAQLQDTLRQCFAMASPAQFKTHARWLDVDSVRPGRYRIQAQEGDFYLLRRLRQGRQEPVQLTFNNVRTINQLAARLGNQLLADSAQLMAAFSDTSLLAEYGLTPPTAICLFLPNTYEVYWTITPEQLLNRMKKENERFWTDERRTQATKIGLSPVEVSVLASIVEEETRNVDEMPMVAGLYLNRLRIGMPLQADPTVKFAVGDFSLRRIKGEHLQVKSPYNTYKNKGLPPGPIRLASAKGIDAVLNATQHPYLYMCAKETLDGTHNFAATLAEHNRNAARYRKALNKLGIN